MQLLFCWRCQMEIPMLDEAEWARVHPLMMPRDPTPPFGAEALAEYQRITGFPETNPAALWHHRISLYGPPCTACGKLLRTPEAKLCAACGAKRSTG